MRLRMFVGLRRRARTGPRLSRLEQRRIMGMIDAGLSHRVIARDHGFTAAEIDCALRCHVLKDFAD